MAILASGMVHSQEKIYYGKVVDFKTNEPIPGVYLMLNGTPFSYTSDKGFFKLSCNPDNVKEIVFHHLSFETDSIALVKLKADTTTIGLKEKYNELLEVSVSPIRIQSLLKKAHQQFVKTYRPDYYWAQSHYKQSISSDGKPGGYLECVGYTYLPLPHPKAWPGTLLMVPEELRRTRENTNILISDSKKDKSDVLQLGPMMVSSNFSEYAFFERIHPLAKFDFNNYEFKFDSIEVDNDNEYVLVFKQKKNIFFIGGWPIMGSSGKIWLDRESLAIRKISSTFYRTVRTIQTEVTYYTIEGIIYPENIKMNMLYNFDDAEESLKKLFLEFELGFIKIDPTAVPNNQKLKSDLEYNIACITTEFDYHPAFWAQYKTEENWAGIINELCYGDQDSEFYFGAKEPIFSKNDPYYKAHTGKMKESSLQFVEQMKRDLKLKD